jgi:hypothetical protein
MRSTKSEARYQAAVFTWEHITQGKQMKHEYHIGHPPGARKLSSMLRADGQRPLAGSLQIILEELVHELEVSLPSVHPATS